MKLKCKDCDYPVAKVTMQGFIMVKYKENHVIVNGKAFNIAVKCQRCSHSGFLEFENGKWLHLDEFKLENEMEIETQKTENVPENTPPKEEVKPVPEPVNP